MITAFFIILILILISVMFSEHSKMQRQIRKLELEIYTISAKLKNLQSPPKYITTDDVLQAPPVDDALQMPPADDALQAPTAEDFRDTAIVNEPISDIKENEIYQPAAPLTESKAAWSFEPLEEPEPVYNHIELNTEPEIELNTRPKIELNTRPKREFNTRPRIEYNTEPKIELKKPRFKFFESENWVGINLFNRLGALLIIVGAIATAAFDGFPEWVRSLILFALAFGVMGVGEYINRKKQTIASIGVSATGVALTYVAIATSFFVLETLQMYTALFACIAATAIGIFLANRYRAEVIGAFALIGGYLPIFSLDPLDETMLIGLVVYFVLLSLFSLMLALTRKWSIMNIIGLALTVMGTVYIGWSADAVIALVYACFAFLLYTALPLIAAYRTKEEIGELDVWLIIVNTFISSAVIFFIAERLDIQHLHAYLCLAFAMIYAGVALWTSKALNHKNLQTVFTLTSIVFCVLFVPFYFEQRWFAVAWVLQAAVLSCYGILHNKKIAEFSGFGILLLSALSLLSFMIFLPEFTLNYTVFTISTLAILFCYIKKGRHTGGYEQVYKVLAFINLWIYVMYIMLTYIEYDNVLTLCSIATFAFAYLYAKVPLWSDRAMKNLAVAGHFVGLFSLLIYMIFLPNLTLNYTVFTISALAILLGYVKEGRHTGGYGQIYKICAFINLWIYVMYIMYTYIEYDNILTLCSVATFALAYLYSKAPLWSDRELKGLAIAGRFVGLFSLLMYMIFLPELTLNYTVFTISASVILFCYIKEGRHTGGHEQAYKVFAFINLWIYTMYIMLTYIEYDNILTLCAIVTFAFAYFYAKVPLWSDEVMKGLAVIAHFVGLVMIWAANFMYSASLFSGVNTGGLIFNLLAVIIGFSIIIYSYLANPENQFLDGYKNINIVNFWLSLLWIFGELASEHTSLSVPLVLIALTIVTAIIITRIPIIYDEGVKIIAMILYIIGIIWLWGFNMVPFANIGGLMVFKNSAVQMLTVFALNDLINHCKEEWRQSHFKILILSGYFLLAVTQVMMVQGNIQFNSAVISIMYGVLAFIWIILGFYLKNKSIRRAGLFLSMASVAKLLIIDTWGLSTEMRIISYISLGVILMLISFIYQKLSRVIDDESD